MEKILKYCFFVLIVVIISAFDSTAQINAQSQEAKEAEQLNAQVLKLYQAGKFSEALPLAERSAALHDRIFGSKNEQTAGALRNLAEVHLAKKNKKESEVIYDQYLNVLGNALGETNPTFIKALDRYVCLLVGIDRRSKP